MLSDIRSQRGAATSHPPIVSRHSGGLSDGSNAGRCWLKKAGASGLQQQNSRMGSGNGIGRGNAKGMGNDKGMGRCMDRDTGMGKGRAKVLGGPPNKVAPRPHWGEIIQHKALFGRSRLRSRSA